MRRFRSVRGWLVQAFGLALVVALTAAPDAGASDATRHELAQYRPNSDARLSILSYNVKGLPWPIAGNRSPELAAIAETLRELRSTGSEPRVVLLQEAFGGNASKIAELAGYRYVVLGPSQAPKAPAPPLGGAYAGAASWSRGEFGRNLVDSGLAILSDYPIVRVARAAFPQGACAGFDCLASKGILLAWIKVPGIPEPILVGDTHLNSRRASGVSFARANRAYDWQVGELASVVSRAIPLGAPVVLGGDFNIGVHPARTAIFGRSGLLGPGRRDDLAEVRSASAANPGAAEIARIIARNKVKLFSREGRKVRIEPVDAWVPFPKSTTVRPLSDHAGFVVEYRVTQAT